MYERAEARRGLPRARRSRWAAGLVALAATAAVAGCGGDGSSDSKGGTTAADATATAPDVVRIAQASAVRTLDLTRNTENPPMAIMHLIGGTLMQLNAAGDAVSPGLAESVDVEDDGLRYVFHLREGLRFSDGSPLTSKDVKATFDAQQRDRANVNAADFGGWKSTSAPDPQTVVIALDKPKPTLETLLAAPWHAVLPASAVGDRTFFSKPISAGPYKIESYTPSGRAIVLGANESYYGEQPSVPRLFFNSVEDENTRILQLRGGQVDIVNELEPAAIKQLEGGGDTTAKVELLAGMYYVWMNNRRGPLSELNVRKAINLALDREQINQVVWGGQNPGIGALLPPGVDGHEENIPIERDVDAAKELLRGTACENGCELEVQARNGRPIDQKCSLILKENLSEIGIDVTVRPVDNAVASERSLGGEFEMEVEWLGLPIPDTSTFLQYAVISDGGIEALFSGYKSREMDAAAADVATTTGAEREEALAKVNEIFARDLPYVPINAWANVLGWRKDVTPFVTYNSGGFFDVAPRS